MEIWVNPACSKCRAATAALDEAGVSYTVRRYLDDPPTREELEAVLARLDLEPWHITRTGEPEAAAREGPVEDASTPRTMAGRAGRAPEADPATDHHRRRRHDRGRAATPSPWRRCSPERADPWTFCPWPSPAAGPVASTATSSSSCSASSAGSTGTAGDPRRPRPATTCSSWRGCSTRGSSSPTRSPTSTPPGTRSPPRSGPTVGAVIGVLLAGDATALDQAVFGVVGGGSALASHPVKAGTRLAINTSPEPFTNSIASVAEDITVLGVVLLAIYHPWIALGVASCCWSSAPSCCSSRCELVRRGWRRWKGRVAFAGPLPGGFLRP